MVSVIVVTFNSRETIAKCLRALDRQSMRDFEVIIVDNDSRDDSTEIVDSLTASLSCPVKKIYLDENTGFASANNRGLASAGGDYIATLNPDAFAQPDWLGELTGAMRERPGTGICASRLLHVENGLIDSAGDIYSSTLKGSKRGESLPGDHYAKPGFVFGACAGAALYRRSMLAQIGFLDDDFFLVHEDTDINLRAQISGWQVFYVPSAVVYHAAHHALEPLSDTAVYYSVRNPDLVIARNLDASFIALHLPQYLLRNLAEFLYFGVKHRKLHAWFRAKRDACRMFGKMREKYRHAKRNRKIDNRRLHALMTPVFDKRLLTAKIKKLLYD